MDNKKNGIPKLRFPGFTGAWEQRKLGEGTLKIGDGLHGTPKYSTSGNVLFINGNNLINGKVVITSETKRVTSNEQSKDDKELNQNTLLMSINGTIGSLAWYRNENLMLGKSVAYIEVSEFDKKFVYAYLQTTKVKFYFISSLTGTTIKNLGLKAIRETPLLIPNIEEQEKIGEFFQQLDSLIALHQRKLEHLQEQKKGLLQKMFPKNGEIVPEVRFPGFTDAWEQRKLGEVVEWSKGSGLSKNDLNIQGKGVPVIHYADLYKFNSVQKEVIHWTIDDMGTNIPENNLLFPMSDVTPDGLARTSTVLQSNVKAGGDVLIAKLNKDVLSPFMSYQVNRNKNQILPLVTGTTVRHISSKSLNSLKVSIPGKNEQKYIGSILMHFDTLIALHQRKLDHLELMKKGLLQQMFV